MSEHLKDYNLEPNDKIEKVYCYGCAKQFNDDDIAVIFGEYLCDDCIDNALKNDVSFLRRLIGSSKVDSEDVNYLLSRLEKINNKERKNGK